MKWILFSLLFAPIVIHAQLISTAAGNGMLGDSGDGGPALLSTLNYPTGIVTDSKGNFYFVEWNGNRVREISTDGIIKTIAGNGFSGFSGDGGAATAAKLNSPRAIAVDRFGSLFIADFGNARLRKVDTFGVISTIAGNGIDSIAGDGGSASAASLAYPSGLAIDYVGNIYIAEDSYIRRIDTNGLITVFAGIGVAGCTGDGGSAVSARVQCGYLAICEDSNLYFQNVYKIRKINIHTNVISTVAGTDFEEFNGDGIAIDSSNIDPHAFCFDKNGNILVSDYYNCRIRFIDVNSGLTSTLVGTGAVGFGGDDSLARLAQLNRPSGVTFDTCGNLMIADEINNRIRKVSFNPECWPQQVPEVAHSGKLSISPNPATTHLTITTPTPIQTLTVTNYLGQAVLRREGSGGDVDVSGLPAGVYVLEVVTEDGNRTFEKFVKE
jgi:trimeric autotransporter adhesin